MSELSDTRIRNAKPRDKEYTLSDRQGLSVRVRASGTKMWLYRYRFGGNRKNLSFGIYPTVTLKMAREKRHAADMLLDQGQDPAVVRQAMRAKEKQFQQTFRNVSQEWLTTKLENENKAKATIKRESWNLAQLNREIGERALCDIEPPELARRGARPILYGRPAALDRFARFPIWHRRHTPKSVWRAVAAQLATLRAQFSSSAAVRLRLAGG
jgi:hypothetical protein